MMKNNQYSTADELMNDPKIIKILTKRLSLAEETSQVLVAARLRMGYTQAKLAKKIHSTQSVIARVESGNTPTRLSIIERIARAYKTNARIVFDSMPDILPVPVKFARDLISKNGIYIQFDTPSTVQYPDVFKLNTSNNSGQLAAGSYIATDVDSQKCKIGVLLTMSH